MVSRLAINALGVAALTAVVSAYQGTSPLVLKSSIPDAASHHCEGVSGKAIVQADKVYDALSSHGCDWDALIVVNIDELHNSHLSQYDPDIQSSQTLLSVPYVQQASSEGLQMAAENWVKQCSKDEKHAKVLVNVRGVKGQGMPIEYLDATTAYPSHYLLISGSPSSSHLSSHPKRQLIDSSNSEDIESIIEEELEEIAQEAELMEGEVDESEWEEEAEDILGGWFGSDEDADENQEEFTSTKFVDEEEDDSDGYYELLDTLQLLKSNGSSSTNYTQLLLLERVTILSTPVITALLISFFILIPILAFGIYALTGIQVPPHMMSIGKTASITQNKKDQ